MLDLNNVTLIIIEPAKPDDAVKTLDICCQNIKFGSSKIFTASKPQRTCIHQLFQIPQFNYEEYSQFVVRNLTDVVDTDFCLIVQTDGFVINANKWTDEFFNYDYIGAKWDRARLVHHCQWIYPHIKQQGVDKINPVGNGGFSLRSKKLLDLCATAPQQFYGPEDAFVCNNNRDYFESFGIKYAPEHIADIFSQDPLIDRAATFGFHGNKGLIYDYIT
jgi:hypothetical protein